VVANAVNRKKSMDSKIVGMRIAEGCKKLGLSQAQFAQKIDMSK